jgi:hypothetical protein
MKGFAYDFQLLFSDLEQIFKFKEHVSNIVLKEINFLSEALFFLGASKSDFLRRRDFMA